MTLPQVRTHEQMHLDAEMAGELSRWRAVQTVRANVSGAAAQDEVLATLGLLDARCPAASH
ncbi:MAG: hypothetical protein M3P95_11315 [Actinomycetota bacterium]|jgi:hypothetical protein|nr:hypothetical protein [Actinomycetota bacterium]